MDVGTIFTSLSAMIKAWGDDSLSVTEKFTTSLSSLGVAAISAIQIFSTISNPTFLNGIKGIGKKRAEKPVPPVERSRKPERRATVFPAFCSVVPVLSQNGADFADKMGKMHAGCH